MTVRSPENGVIHCIVCPWGQGGGHWHPPHHCHVPHGTDGHEPGTHGSHHPPEVPRGCPRQPWPGRGPVSTRQHVFSAGARGAGGCVAHSTATAAPCTATWPVMSFRAKFLLSPIFFSSSLVVWRVPQHRFHPAGAKTSAGVLPLITVVVQKSADLFSQ